MSQKWYRKCIYGVRRAAAAAVLKFEKPVQPTKTPTYDKKITCYDAAKLLHQEKGPMKPATVSRIVFAQLVFIALLSGNAWALQTHDGVEGVVVHQLAHIQYLGALGYLLWDIRRSSFAGIGWIYLQRFCWLMMFWNCLAFFGHFSQVALPNEAVTTEDGYLSALLLLPFSFGKWIYYITALDHLLCAPALFFLYLAMRSFYRSLKVETGEDGK